MAVSLPASRSRVFAVVSWAFETMTATKYRHHNVENAAAGTYYFDCVGMANYFLSLGAPNALAALRASERTRTGYVPSPDHFAEYLQALPREGTRVWRPICEVCAIEPGDLIAMKKLVRPDGRTFVGHAMIAAGIPVRRSDGSWALDVFDSTGSPHGLGDSRRNDPRAIPKRPGAPAGSGLGIGTIQLWPDGAGSPWQISWRIGKPPVPTPIAIARALQ